MLLRRQEVRRKEVVRADQPFVQAAHLNGDLLFEAPHPVIANPLNSLLGEVEPHSGQGMDRSISVHLRSSVNCVLHSSQR